MTAKDKQDPKIAWIDSVIGKGGLVDGVSVERAHAFSSVPGKRTPERPVWDVRVTVDRDSNRPEGVRNALVTIDFTTEDYEHVDYLLGKCEQDMRRARGG